MTRCRASGSGSIRAADGRLCTTTAIASVGGACTRSVFGALTIQNAREHAQRLAAKILDGANPVSDRVAARKAATVKEFAAEYLERRAKIHKKTWPEDQRRIEKHIARRFGSRRLEDVNRADVARLHSQIGGSHPYEANRVLC